MRQPEYSEKKAASVGGKEIAQLQEIADAEQEDNKLEFRRRQGDRVPYGQTIQLFHVASQRFVRISTSTTSRREPSQLKVDLSEEITRASWFRIMPRFKVRTEGDPIRMEDLVLRYPALPRAHPPRSWSRASRARRSSGTRASSRCRTCIPTARITRSI